MEDMNEAGQKRIRLIERDCETQKENPEDETIIS